MDGRNALSHLVVILLACTLGPAACGDSDAMSTDAATTTDDDTATSADTNATAGPTTDDATAGSDGSGSTSSDGSTGSTDPDPTSDASSDPSATSDPTDPTDPTDPSTTGEPPAGCGMPHPGAGWLSSQSIMVDGLTREFNLFIPSGYDPNTPTSLVLNFHGLLGTPAQQADFSQFNDTAEARGIVVAYPAGIGNSFNAGACCGKAHDDGVNDILFARELVNELLATLCIDPRRVYATGMSNGGHMAHALACRAADVFAATASVAGVLGFAPADCAPSRPISMLDFHGDADLIVSYNGAGPGYPAVVPMMKGWAARDNCQTESQVTFQQGDMTCETWPGCQAGVEVTLCTIAGGGHCWPGNGSCIFGHSSTELHASEAIADMFAAQTLP